MRDTFEQIRQQIHEIRNVISPVNLKLADLEHQFLANKSTFEEKTLTIESKLFGAGFRLDKLEVQIAKLSAVQQELLARVKQCEQQRPPAC